MTFPPDFITRTEALPDINFPELEAALQLESPVSIRINREKMDRELPEEKVRWCETGYYLPERLSFTFDPLFHAGCYYVQEASSMFLEQAIRRYVEHPVVCLDLCAAPGGKSTHLASLLPQGSLLVSNEVIRSRSHILSENIIKWGSPNSIVTQSDPAEIGRLTHLFDVIVADVPCSGEGMFRKDPDSMTEWSVANVELCAARQRRIIHDCWEALKPGGLLIYSTCTYNTEENEENIHYFTEELGAEALSVPTDPAWQITGPVKYNHPVYRFFPHRTKGEGFFLAVLQKEEGVAHPIRYKAKQAKEKKKALQSVPSEVKNWLSNPASFLFEMKDNHIHAIPTEQTDLFRLITDNLRVVSSGISLGELKGKDILPSHSLAMSNQFNQDAFAKTELGWDEAICFLKKEALQLSSETERGFLLVTYQGHPLGFVKNDYPHTSPSHKK